jgi:hypothetical protein
MVQHHISMLHSSPFGLHAPRQTVPTYTTSVCHDKISIYCSKNMYLDNVKLSELINNITEAPTFPHGSEMTSRINCRDYEKKLITER